MSLPASMVLRCSAVVASMGDVAQSRHPRAALHGVDGGVERSGSAQGTRGNRDRSRDLTDEGPWGSGHEIVTEPDPVGSFEVAA
jgi:hypothetical protein